MINESREILIEIINDFSPDKFTRFFRDKNRSFTPQREELRQYDDCDFKNGLKLGDISFSSSEKLIICTSQVKQPLSERSGKKLQYEKGKKILKDRQYDAGIFIFYDTSNNFRFSLIYANYLDKRRDWSVFRRFTYFVGIDLTNKTFKQRVGDGDFSTLEKIKDAFSVEKVTKEFYQDIANWYFWAVQHSTFPKDVETEENGRNIAVIRLITRMIFIWFMRERGLVSKSLFKKENISNILKDLNSNESTYYEAILQNLFFATLSTKKNERKFRSEIRGHKGYNPDFGNQSVFRFQELFKNPEKIKDYFSEIPFLNGGLFECLDDKPNGIYIDGFTSVKKNQPTVPNFLFFNQEKKTDLNKAYGTKGKIYKVHGLLDILSSFNFTIDENSPDDADIALDPELLGRVFENLLASFNPETSMTARKATGSYYTPREIVDYMVTESLKAYFKTHLSNIKDFDKKIAQLFQTGNEENPFEKQESKKLVELIESVRIVDPAVGSGAFPMGVLNKLVFILNKVDHGNELWKQAQLSAVDTIPDPRIKQDTRNRIEEFFKGKNADYGRKLYLIQKCIYGVDIQQIAVEISKLRFFISLLVDEKIDKTKENWGIEPLPNLDFKIMQGNSLLEEYEGIKLFDEKLIAGIDFNNTKLIESMKRKQSELQKKYLDLHGKNKLTKIKQAELNEELKKLDKQLKNLSKQDKKDEEVAGLFDAQNEAKQKKEALKRLHKEFFETSEKEVKGKIKKQIEEMEWDLIEATLKEQNKITELKKIEKFKKSNTKPFFLWKLNFADVFENGGFDIVIGNPPYVEHKKLKYISSVLKKNYLTYSGTADLYVYFYENGINNLKENGILIYITSNKFLKTSYGENLRKYFTAFNINEIIDFTDVHVFEALIASCIFCISKSVNSNNNVKVAFVNDSLLDFTDVAMFVYNNGYFIKQNTFSEKIWQLGNKTKLALKEKIEKGSVAMGKTGNINIYRGVTTGFNPAFIIDEEKRKELIKEDNANKGIIKPLLQGRNIKKWIFISSNENLLFVPWHFPLHNDTSISGSSEKAEKKLKAEYSSLYWHMQKFKMELSDRNKEETGIRYEWYTLQRCAASYYTEFEREKIIWGLTADKWAFAYDNKNHYLPSNGYILTSEKYSLKYLLALMNSKLLEFYFGFIGIMTAGGAYTLKHETISLLPIKETSDKVQKPFIETVDKILAITKSSDYLGNPEKQAQVKKYECCIDQMVYELYGLTEEGIKIVDGKNE